MNTTTSPIDRLLTWSNAQGTPLACDGANLARWFLDIERAFEVNEVPDEHQAVVALALISNEDLQGAMEERMQFVFELSSQGKSWEWKDFKEDLCKVVAAGTSEGPISIFRRNHPYLLASMSTGLVVAGGAVLAPAAGILALNTLGFTALGVEAGSIAAILQSAIYGGGTTGIFSIFQSIGATAVLPNAGGLIASASALTAGVGLGGRGSKRLSNAHLEFTSQELLIWRKSFLPAALAYLAHSDHPWSIDDTTQLALWGFYRSFDLPPDPRETDIAETMAYALMCQRVEEWRGRIGRFAREVVAHFFQSEGDLGTTETRVIYVRQGLARHFPFVYGDFENRLRIFRAKHILLTFGFMLHGISLSNTQYQTFVGGLALVVTAVQRALSLWSTGEEIPLENRDAFNDRTWVFATSKWAAVCRHLSNAQWANICREARLAYGLYGVRPRPQPEPGAGLRVPLAYDRWAGMRVDSNDE
ncbi:hypothetical protein FA15DRAFT_619484 [Coprinopsis marcescibilis]|uniref:DUF6532 domain-containing protein n=1 Tax=Coprinopsis marcescibilis TaxID=230819 RepID=A0A5C3L7U8_COPMA|nr:hypothetical protein FA15DRAFT_619484 [Coprinopsis marcescibilis]